MCQFDDKPLIDVLESWLQMAIDSDADSSVSDALRIAFVTGVYAATQIQKHYGRSLDALQHEAVTLMEQWTEDE